jgi:hypothetical protein
MSLDIAKAESNTARRGRCIVLSTLRHLTFATIEVVEESFMGITIASEVCGFLARVVEILGMLDGPYDVGVVLRSCGSTTWGLGITLSFEAADHELPDLAAGAPLDAISWRAGGELVGWGCGGDGSGRGEDSSEDGKLHG